jgi:hypothetical protein
LPSMVRVCMGRIGAANSEGAHSSIRSFPARVRPSWLDLFDCAERVFV